jgi:dimethylargininase
MLIAVTREVSRRIGRCELSYQDRLPVDLALARRQHRRYEECLVELGCRLVRLPEEPDLPDAVFVEDTAIVLDEIAIITRPGAPSRRPENASVARALRPYRPLVFVQEPGTLDGGDVLRIGNRLFIGRSRRSNEAAIRQVRASVEARGYRVSAVPVKGCLHLKSAVTQVAEDTLLINRAWVDAETLGTFRLIDVDPAEPGAANALRVKDVVIFSNAYPNTRRRLESAGVHVRGIDVSELHKAEGGVTCCSLVFIIQH